MFKKLYFLTKRLIFTISFLISPDNKRSILIRFYYGCKVGKNVKWTGMPIMGSESKLISIGDDVTIARNVVFHTHDGAVRLFRDEYPGINRIGKITIGNNVFVGSDCIIMPNITIGDNVIIGSGSIVTKSIPSDKVAAGVPAKKLNLF